MDTGISYPFADRLLEYLLDTPITSAEDISDNIRRVQKGLVIRHGVLRPNTENQYYTGLSSYTNYGIWEPYYKGVIYDIIKKDGVSDVNLLSQGWDMLGFVDKDTEKLLKKYIDVDIYSKENGGDE